MKQSQGVLTVQTDGPGLYEFSNGAVNWCADQNINTGLLTIYIRHTSASLTIQENADLTCCVTWKPLLNAWHRYQAPICIQQKVPTTCRPI